VVLDNFSNSKNEEGVKVTAEHIQDFAEAGPSPLLPGLGFRV
jgi:hypothetical protein